MRALIVDPSSAIAFTLSSLFAKFCINAHVAKNGHDAIELLKKTSVDILCFSYELGDMNGIDFFTSAKSRELLHQQPSLMFSSSSNRTIIRQALEAGVTDCIPKNNLKQLEQFVERFVASDHARISGKILLVEDSATTAALYRQMLSRIGLSVDISRSAEDAILKFSANQYDLVVTDYFLAGNGTGFTVIRAIRDTVGKKSATPIIAISSSDDMARKVEILRNGANDFVAKPVVAEELEVRVFNLLNMRRLMERLESQHEAMKHLAMRDQLTSLYNRHYLQDAVPDLMRSTYESEQPLSIMVIDIDHFKHINDSYGHKTGDYVIEKVAKILQESCSKQDLVARIGGEEFVAVLPNTIISDALSRAEDFRLKTEALMPNDIAISVSIGIATATDAETYDGLFSRADSAMYRAKMAGRNRVEWV
jgi:two-component system cell cycle response regulator